MVGDWIAQPCMDTGLGDVIGVLTEVLWFTSALLCQMCSPEKDDDSYLVSGDGWGLGDVQELEFSSFLNKKYLCRIY